MKKIISERKYFTIEEKWLDRKKSFHITGRTDNSAHVARQHRLQIRLIQPMLLQVGRTSSIAETDYSAESVLRQFALGRIIQLPRRLFLLVNSSTFTLSHVSCVMA